MKMGCFRKHVHTMFQVRIACLVSRPTQVAIWPNLFPTKLCICNIDRTTCLVLYVIIKTVNILGNKNLSIYITLHVSCIGFVNKEEDFASRTTSTD